MLRALRSKSVFASAPRRIRSNGVPSGSASAEPIGSEFAARESSRADGCGLRLSAADKSDDGHGVRGKSGLVPNIVLFSAALSVGDNPTICERRPDARSMRASIRKSSGC